MSIKRQATTELNHENWDQDDPVDQEEIGSFKIAPKDILEKRVIRTAKRRTQATSDEPKRSVFSGFGGFNKKQPTSFDFLSKVANSDNKHNTVTSKADSSATSGLFTSKPSQSSPGSGLFSLQSSTATLTKSPFGSLSTPTVTSSLLGVSTGNTSASSNLFTSKADSTVSDSPFKLQTVTSSTDNKIDCSKSMTFTSSKFDVPSTSSNVTKSPFSSTSSLFQIQPTTTAQSSFHIKKTDSLPSVEEKNSDDIKSDSKIKYYSKLKHLNESVSEWIKKHIEETPLCILTPIFKDYDKYIKQIQDEYQKSSKEEIKKVCKIEDESKFSDEKSDFKSSNSQHASVPEGNAKEFNEPVTSKSLLTPQRNSLTTTDNPAPLSFGRDASTVSPSIVTSGAPTFSFGISTKTSQSSTTTSSLFSVATSSVSSFSFATSTSKITTNGSSPPFSFGVGKPFSFSSNVKQNTEKTEEECKKEEDDAPPKVEYTPVVEENSIYDKKCKIFVKKEGNFVDKGVGTLYVKKIEESDKYQLLVRANTNLGSVLINLILSSSIPIQRMGKNNIMMVCIPTPDSKPPPTPILIRVKTSEEADELLAALDKYKK